MADLQEIDDLLASLGFNQDAPSELGSSLLGERPSSTTPDGRLGSGEISGQEPSGLGKSSHEYSLLGGQATFTPRAPESLEQTGLHLSEVSDIILKFMVYRGLETGFNIAQHVGVRFPLIEHLMRQLKSDRLVAYKNSAGGADYVYELTELGRERARELSKACSYFGTAPVPLEQYIAGVQAQSIAGKKPTLNAIANAFSDLEINDRILSNIGQAIHSGRGMFLFGPPGNGKTSLAERITKSFGDSIWIPRAIVAAGEIVRLYDPNRHKLINGSNIGSSDDVDGRWVQIERPTISAGGELRMENLEISYIRNSGIGEAPLQLKANCGTLLIDDFGRQRMAIDELLNRWIVPLEQRHDFLHLESGRMIQVPFDQLIIFSSNLEPRDLVDDAFLRRIPYKIEIRDPNRDEFAMLFQKVAKDREFKIEPGVIDYMVECHYIRPERPFRFCHPRDLMRQMENRCTLHEFPRIVTKDAVDQAVENYFSIM